MSLYTRPKIVVIGGGASGFFAAISAKTHHPEAEVTIYEKTHQYLSKVKISGGGRCNVTHDCKYPSQLIKYYPRGKAWLKKPFSSFGCTETIRWFEDRGVPLKVESDGRVFPVSDSSDSIIKVLIKECERSDIALRLKSGVDLLTSCSHGIKVQLADGSSHVAEAVIIATGGHNKISAYKWLTDIGHTVATPVPSLFTFNMPKNPVTTLMGVVAPHVRVSIRNSAYTEDGPLLITHWGMSGPAILKLSAWAARWLHNQAYQFDIQINWAPDLSAQELRSGLDLSGNKQIKNHNPTSLPSRLWEYIIDRAGLDPSKSWKDQTKKNKNKLINILQDDQYSIQGKTTFKEEFVTCGGVSLDEIDPVSMQSKMVNGLYFAGEVMDIDALTGGFNFQVAWTTGYIAGQLIDNPFLSS